MSEQQVSRRLIPYPYTGCDVPPSFCLRITCGHCYDWKDIINEVSTTIQLKVVGPNEWAGDCPKCGMRHERYRKQCPTCKSWIDEGRLCSES